MKFLIFIILFFVCLYYRAFIPFFLFNIKYFIYYGFRDIYFWFKHKKYNEFKGFGRIILYSGCGSQVFGSGKTASMIHEVLDVYNKYNDLDVWSEKDHKFVKQKIHIISNVELYDIPYIKFENINQFVDLERYGFQEQDITIFLLDESGSIFNSREFRDNISTEFLRTLLQSRKNKVALYMTSQRLQFTDKILREICSVVVECKKTWRCVRCREYNALDLEYAVNPEVVKPILTRYWFTRDEDFHAYNSFQLVEQIKKKYDPKDFLSTAEILETYGNAASDIQISNNLKKRYRPLGKNK